MAGGLFGRVFVLNVKCIIFALLIMIIFVIKPNMERNIVIYPTLFIIFVISYVAMAWYDYYYDCRVLPLKRNKISFTGLFKPPAHSNKQFVEKQIVDNRKKLSINDEVKREEYRNKLIIYVSHIIFIVPIILYVVIYKHKVNKMIYPILAVLAIFTLLYHGGSLITLSHINDRRFMIEDL